MRERFRPATQRLRGAVVLLATAQCNGNYGRGSVCPPRGGMLSNQIQCGPGLESMRSVCCDAFFFVAASVVCVTAVRAAEDAPDGARGAAFTFAKRVITPILKNPASADFEWSSVSVDRVMPVKSEAGNSVELVFVSGLVRATNSFNAVVPSEWQVTMWHDENGYEGMIVVHDDKIILKTEKGERFLNVMNAKQDKQQKQMVAEAAEKAQRQREENKAKADGHVLGEKHGAKLGTKAKVLRESEISKRARKFAADAGYAEERLVEQFENGYADAISAAAR
jgi:hypothetical protein